MVYCNTLPSKYDVETASEHIDTLTYGRINKIGWDKLTQFQKKTISRVCEKLAIFEHDNKAALSSIAGSISLGSISMTIDFNTDAFYKMDGVVIPADLYATLIRTGLCRNVID